MNWRKWKLGCVVAFVLSLLVALAGLYEGTTWRQFLAIFGSAALTHFVAFLHEHPIESIEFTTKGNNEETNNAGADPAARGMRNSNL